MRFLTYISVKTTEKSKGEQSLLFIRSLDMFDSMPLLTVWMITAVEIFGISQLFSPLLETVMHFMYIPRRKCVLQANSSVSSRYGKTVGVALYLQTGAHLI